MAGLPLVDGKEITYLCAPPPRSSGQINQFGRAGTLLSDPRRSAPVWTILDANNNRITRVPIHSAWW